MSNAETSLRTEYAGRLASAHIGKTITVVGWVHSRRDHGALVFIDLRDREGLLQVVLDPSVATMASSKDLRREFVVKISGVVEKRPAGMINSKLQTGEVELRAQVCEILNTAQTLPFELDDESVHESLRLQYRYLDLRSPRLQSHLKLRHRVLQMVRNFLSQRDFLEVETPILYKSTPEGARDYLVPSRVNPGQFYALPQSPQTLKQLLMISGYDRYFQIARCFRDEDLRADRQPEFSQIDLEMSFVDQEDVINVNESLLKLIWKEFRGADIGKVPRMTFQEAMDRFGSDKPDIRFGMEIQDLGGLIGKGSGFKVFDDVLGRGGVVRGLSVPGGGGFSRGQFDKLTDISKRAGAKGLIWIKQDQGTWTSPISKFFSADRLAEMFAKCGAKVGDCALIVADDFDPACAALSALRLHLGNELKLIPQDKDAFLWVVDFPLLEYSPSEGRWGARHHPFTAPQDQFVGELTSGKDTGYGKLLAKAYDLVCNGYEIAGGSIRIHRNEVQQAMFRLLGMSEKEIKNKFGFFIDALQYGTPPHGGIAWGLDRLVMILARTEAIREVIAFPKTAKATDLMAQCPSDVSFEQLTEVGLELNGGARKLAADRARAD